MRSGEEYVACFGERGRTRFRKVSRALMKDKMGEEYTVDIGRTQSTCIWRELA